MRCAVALAAAALAVVSAAPAALSRDAVSHKSGSGGPSYPPDVLKNMNLTADPCNDFYEYACGGWITANSPLPPTEDAIYKSISTIQSFVDATLATILEDNTYAKLTPMYANCMDRKTINALGVAPLQPYRFTTLGSLQDVSAAAGKLLQQGMSPFFAFSATIDAENPSTQIGELDQGGFTLPTRDLYLSPSQLLNDYESTITQLFTLLGDSPVNASAKAAAVLRVETQLAKLALPADEIRDPFATYNRANLTYLNQVAPNFPWGIYFESAGIDVLRTLNIAEPSVLTAVDAYLGTAAIADLSAYIDWTLLYNVVSNNLLPDAFVNVTFAFFTNELEGQSQPDPLDATCVGLTNQYLGDLVSQYFVQQAFAGNSLAVATGMVNTIVGTFLNNLQNVSWMDAPTKAQAVQKENLLSKRVGYPTSPNPYTNYNVVADKHLATVLSFQKAAFQQFVVQAIGRPSNRNAWAMFADTVNAYYDAPTNSITIPAAILQQPFFSAQNDPALNFAGIGVVIGHENSHGFDDQGRDYDGAGTLRNWWSPSSLAQFEEKVTCMINQYSQYEVLPGVYVNGNLTIGENIADNGGVKTSYYAYKSSTATPNPQLFFVAYAQGWCSVATPQFLQEQVQSDVHSPAKFRAIGPLQNRPEFAAAFSCPVGSKMNPATQCEVW